MGILGEFLIISAAALSGALFSSIPGFPLPGAVTGMIVMLILLITKLVNPERVKKAGDFFLKFLPLFFIPLIVNLIKEEEVLSSYGIKIIIIVMITTVLTLLATGLTAKLLLNLNKKKDSADD